MKLFQIVLNIAIGIAAGAQPIVGYNYGAKKFKRVRELLGLIVKWTAIVCLICTVLFEVFPLFFIQMFGADGELYTLILFTCVQKVCAIFLQSIGHAKAAVPLSILRDVLLIVFSIASPMVWGVTGIFWAAPIADVLAVAVTAVVMLRLWNRLKAEDGQPAEGKSVLQQSRPGIIITIAREHGTAGKKIGQLVAQKLGVPCYYKEMTALAAQESGLAKEFISGINSDENAIMRELYLSTSAVQQAVIAQAKAINMIADQGSCVIIGRAADYVLQNRKNVVRIFIHAPKDYRVKKVMEMYGDTELESRKSIARSDSARGTYYKSISGHVWGDPHQYELSVDSSIGPEKTAELICGYVSHI